MILFSYYDGRCAAWKRYYPEAEMEAGRCRWESCSQAGEGGQGVGGGVLLAPGNSLREERGVREREERPHLYGFGPPQWDEWSCLLPRQVKRRDDWFKGAEIQRLVSGTWNLMQ